MADQIDKLAMLWTSQDKEVAQKMVFMYTKNSKLRDWWGQVLSDNLGAFGQVIGHRWGTARGVGKTEAKPE